MSILKLAKDNEELCIKMRRDLHMIPELELELPKTVKYVKDRLDEFNIPYTEMVKGNGIVATVYGSGKGKCLAIRADMDALPIEEETGLSFSSTHKGNMHACGHDSHTAIAITAAKIINENKDKIKGAVKFIFQPGEEILGGANSQKTVDPIIISAEILMAIQKIISREIAPFDSGLVSVCKINGGFTQNIIPNEVDMLGTSRALDEKVRDLIEKRIKEISVGIAKTYGGDAEVNY